VPALIRLDEAKNILNVRDAGEEDLIKALIEGVTSVIEHEVGAVTERTITMELRQGARSAVALPESNVISLTSGVDTRSGTAIDVAGMRVSDGGILRRTNGAALPNGPWQLTAVVGMAEIPEAIRRAATEVLKEAWAIRVGPDTEAHKRPFLISYRTMVWLEPYRTGPGFS